MGLIASIALLLALFAYIFWPEAETVPEQARTRVDFLQERRDAVMSNLRDLSFEFRAGKYPAEDYEAQRNLLEREAADILREMDVLQEAGAVARTTS